MSLLQNSNAISSGGYDINNSLRFRSNGYLSRAYSSSGTIDTWSFWIKRGKLGSAQTIFGTSNGVNQSFGIEFTASDTIQVYDYLNAFRVQLYTTQVFRDPSAWYHIVLAIDTTQATAANRVKLYVNGVQVTAFTTATYPTINQSLNIGGVLNLGIGITGNIGGQLYDGYMTEWNFIDGQALTPSSFGETDTVTGSWVAKKYTGTYGTNGFYLKFSDIATTSGSNAGLGKDFSGNSNYWTTNNISVTAGTTYDAMTDSPTLTSATVANYCVINPIKRNVCTISNANLTAAGPAAYTKSVVASMSMPSGSGKYYWEAVFTRTSTTDGDVNVGIVSTTWNAGEATGSPSTYPGNTSDSWGATGNSGNKITNGSGTSYGSSFASGDIIMVAYDAVNGSFYVGKNGTWFNSGVPASNTGYAFTGITTEVLPGFGMAYDSGSSIVNANFGQRPFSYTPPTGFVRLNTYNLPDSTIVKGNSYMDATLYTGTGTAGSGTLQTISTQFSPNFLWLKNRTSGSSNHILIDSIRGNNSLSTNNTAADVLNGNQALGTNNYIVAEANGAGIAYNPNLTGNSYVGWIWNGGSSTVTNTSGTISSQVRANATAGFSIVTYTGTGANATVGHGLGVAPKMIIVKNRNDTNIWVVYHSGLTSASYFLQLASTAAQTSNATVWNSTAPTSTVFSIGTNGATNQSASQTYVAYCWAEIAGFSKFGSYTGGGATTFPFIYTGFRPKYILIKCSTSGGTFFAWYAFDSSRSPYNFAEAQLEPNASSAEIAGAKIDFLSNGFKLRDATDYVNGSAGTYIYAAFAENPTKYALAR